MRFFNKAAPIGVFDSGIGGLTVVKKLLAMLPNEKIVYFGDTARVPYGSKSNSTIIEYANQDAKFLHNKKVKLIIAACNTASSVALDNLRDQFDIPIIGMIEPGSKYALSKTKNGKIGVIGTHSTISNEAYSRQLKQLNSEIEVFEKACPLFVPLAEEGWTDHKATELIAEEYLDELIKEEITKKFQLHEKDTGSADVQIAILTERITELTDHLKLAPKDHNTRLALLKLVGQRRKLLDYLNSTDTKRYQSLIVKLKLRK